LAETLRRFGVGLRHRVDSKVWRTIAGALHTSAMTPAVHKAIFDGEGDAVAWLDEGTLLRGPKIRLWAYPGGATIRRIDQLRVCGG
jgi:hypothetical protein